MNRADLIWQFPHWFQWAIDRSYVREYGNDVILWFQHRTNGEEMRSKSWGARIKVCNIFTSVSPGVKHN